MLAQTMVWVLVFGVLLFTKSFWTVVIGLGILFLLMKWALVQRILFGMTKKGKRKES